MFVCVRTTFLCSNEREKKSEKKTKVVRVRDFFEVVRIYSGGDCYCNRSPARRRGSLIIRFARSQAKLITVFIFTRVGCCIYAGLLSRT